MAKITFIGAGSTIFARNILGDALLLESLHDADIALYDIDAQRLQESRILLEAINNSVNNNSARISTYLGTDERRAALRGADYVVNAIQVGGYDPSTLLDFEIPRKYGLRQTIADTLGIGGIFRGLRTIPVMLDITNDIQEVCPDAWLMNYSNPMCIITGALQQATEVRTVGLCHSVQECVPVLFSRLGLDTDHPPAEVDWHIAGINHQAWLLKAEHDGQDLYPIIRERAHDITSRIRQKGAGRWFADMAARLGADPAAHDKVLEAAARAADAGELTPGELSELQVCTDLVRLEFMFRFGYYVTESSEHNAEYVPWFIRRDQSELIEEFNIPLDEYPRRCVEQIAGWEQQRDSLLDNADISHEPSHEFGAYIMNALETGEPFEFAGNVSNDGLIDNLPARACVEVTCTADANGITPHRAGELPEQCAALNRTNINPQLLTIQAALTRRREHIYQAALLDPHTSAELSIENTIALCDEMIEAHGDFLPTYK